MLLNLIPDIGSLRLRDASIDRLRIGSIEIGNR